MSVVRFFFDDFFHFIGLCIVIALTGQALENIVDAFRNKR